MYRVKIKSTTYVFFFLSFIFFGVSCHNAIAKEEESKSKKFSLLKKKILGDHRGHGGIGIAVESESFVNDPSYDNRPRIQLLDLYRRLELISKASGSSINKLELELGKELEDSVRYQCNSKIYDLLKINASSENSELSLVLEAYSPSINYKDRVLANLCKILTFLQNETSNTLVLLYLQTLKSTRWEIGKTYNTSELPIASEIWDQNDGKSELDPQDYLQLVLRVRNKISLDPIIFTKIQSFPRVPYYKYSISALTMAFLILHEIEFFILPPDIDGNYDGSKVQSITVATFDGLFNNFLQDKLHYDLGGVNIKARVASDFSNYKMPLSSINHNSYNFFNIFDKTEKKSPVMFISPQENDFLDTPFKNNHFYVNFNHVEEIRFTIKKIRKNTGKEIVHERYKALINYDKNIRISSSDYLFKDVLIDISDDVKSNIQSSRKFSAYSVCMTIYSTPIPFFTLEDDQEYSARKFQLMPEDPSVNTFVPHAKTVPFTPFYYKIGFAEDSILNGLKIGCVNNLDDLAKLQKSVYTF